MKLEKIKNMKQKIITMPIIIITLISFIIPNYANASWFSDLFGSESNGSGNLLGDTGNAILEAICDLFLLIPNSINSGLQDFFMKDELKNNTKVSGTTQQNLYFGPGLIFANKIKMFDVNFFENKSKKDNSLSAQLRNVIATWYIALRNIGLVLMLLVLVFIGIKITISSVASDKAKYKQLLVDWLVAVCLLVFMHYIMVFSVNLTEAFTDMFSGTYVKEFNGKPMDLQIRAALTRSYSLNDVQDRFYWALIYMIYTALSLTFVWQYLKRVIKIAFLTLFAPLMAASYPIDKMMDGKAQAFDRWLKDYMFTLMIQPLQMLLYSILVGSLSTLASTNGVYGIVALCSLIPIEKLLREYLGFDRGHVKGPNPTGALAAASLLSGAAKKVLPSNLKVGNKGGNGNSGSQNDNAPSRPIDTRRGDSALDLLASGENDRNSENDRNNRNGRNVQNTENRNSNMEQNNAELDETGQQWQDYIDSQEEQESRGKNNNTDLDETGQQWQDYIDSQEEQDNIQQMPRENQNDATENNMSQQNGENIDRPQHSMVGNRFRAVGRGAKSFAKATAPGVKKGLKKGVKIAGAVTLGSVGGLAGFALGAATGNAENAIKYAAAGAAGGGALGTTGVGAAMGIASGTKNVIKNTSDTFRSAYNPTSYNETLKKRRAKEDYKNIMSDSNAMLALRTKAQKYNISEKQLKETVSNYTSQGITDYKDISKGMELQQEAGVTQRQAMGAIKLSKDFDKSTLRKDETKVKQEIQNNLQGKDANPEQKAQKSVDLMKMVYGMTPTRRL